MRSASPTLSFVSSNEVNARWGSLDIPPRAWRWKFDTIAPEQLDQRFRVHRYTRKGTFNVPNPCSVGKWRLSKGAEQKHLYIALAGHHKEVQMMRKVGVPCCTGPGEGIQFGQAENKGITKRRMLVRLVGARRGGKK